MQKPFSAQCSCAKIVPVEYVWIEQSRFDEGHDIVEARWDPTGRHVVLVRYATPLTDEDDPEDHKRVIQVGVAGDSTALWTRVCGRSSPVVSPDGLLLAHEDRGRHILVRNIVTAKVTCEVDCSRFGGQIRRITWNRDSSQIAVELSHASFMTHIFDARSGDRLMRSADGQFMGWSPSGRHFAISYEDEIDVLDAKFFVDELTTQTGPLSGFSWSPDGHSALITDYEGWRTQVVHLEHPQASFSMDLRAGFTRWSPDSSRVLICQSETISSREPRTYSVLNVTTGEVSQILESTGPTGGSGNFGTLGMSWSPDSRRVSLVEFGDVYDADSDDFQSTARVILLDTLGQGSYEVIPDSMAFSWSPDGDQGMACSWSEGKHRGIVRRVDESNPLLVVEGDSHEVWHEGVETNYASEHSPNLLFAIQDVGRTCLELWDPWKGHRIGTIPFTPDEEDHERIANFKTVIWSPDGTRLLIQRTAQRVEVWSRT